MRLHDQTRDALQNASDDTAELAEMDLHLVGGKKKKPAYPQPTPTTHNLIEYRPRMIGRSRILNLQQVSNLVGQLPTFYRECSWKRIFGIEEDGTSLITFYEKCRDVENTLLVVQDNNGWVFGGYCNEAWREGYRFFGNGDNFVFTFKNTQEV